MWFIAIDAIVCRGICAKKPKRLVPVFVNFLLVASHKDFAPTHVAITYIAP